MQICKQVQNQPDGALIKINHASTKTRIVILRNLPMNEYFNFNFIGIATACGGYEIMLESSCQTLMPRSIERT